MSLPSWKVPLADVVVDDELVAATIDAVSSGWWSMGPRVAAFEDAFSQFCDTKHAFAVANGTAALHLALLAVGCGPGDEVIVPSLNFVASANTVIHAGATPVFCDIVGDNDLTMDPADVEAAVGPATKAIVVMHYGGFACRMDEIREIAAARNLVIVEDAAHAPGATYHGQPCGTLGDIGCFSFFSNKNLPIGEGGMVVTDDPELAERLRLLRSHGMTTLTWDRHRGHASSYDVVTPGLNYRLDELRAAIGLVQLTRLPGENEGRRAASTRYRAALHETAGIVMPFQDADALTASSHHLAVVVLPYGADRDAVRISLQAEGIQTSVHYPPIHQFSHYAALGTARRLPRTDGVASRLLTLPLFGKIDDWQIDLVVDGLLKALSEAER